MREPDCGGCKGQGAHSRRCRTHPGWFWYRLQDQADELGDLIGSNDPEAANMAYAIAGRMKARAHRQVERARCYMSKVDPWRPTWTLMSSDEEPPVNDEVDFGRELVEDEVPYHLRPDAPPLGQCNRCLRKTWAASEIDTEDRMTQPDGNPCGGRIVTV